MTRSLHLFSFSSSSPPPLSSSSFSFCAPLFQVYLSDFFIIPWLLNIPLSSASVNLREQEKKILDSITDQGTYDRRVRPSGRNVTVEGANLIKGPWFEEEPIDTYIVNQPISLKCKVHDALSVHFQCNQGREDDIRQRETSHGYNDPETGQRITEVTLNVSKKDIDNPLITNQGLLRDISLTSSIDNHNYNHNIDDKSIYKCWCTAFGGSQRVHIDSRQASVQFSCFNCDDDSAEIPSCYKICGPVDGLWSPWSAYSTCSHDCQQVRRRTCTNPPPKYGGRDCTGPDSFTRNCTGGMCRKLDPFQLTRSEEGSHLQYPRSSSSSPDDRKPEIYILCFVIAISTALICLAVFIYVLMSQRRYKQPESMIGDDTGCEEDGQTMLLLMQQQKHQHQQLLQQQQQLHPQQQSQQDQLQFNPNPQHSQVQQSSQSEYIYSNESVIGRSTSPEEKMHLISRLNGYNGNIIDHLVVRRDALRANCPNIETSSLVQTPSHHSLSSQTQTQPLPMVQHQQQQTMYIQRSSPSPGSCCNTNSSTPRLGRISSRPGATPPSSSSANTTVTATTSEDDNNYESEADYAEPFVSNFSLFTPERKPPLPSTRPPSTRTEDHRSDNVIIRANSENTRPQSQQQKQLNQQQSVEPVFPGETLFLRSATKWR